MDHLDKISVEGLQEALNNVDGKKPTERLLAAIAYKNGVTQTELAEWYNVERRRRRTIYSRLKRLDTDESLEHVVTDAHQSGRPRKFYENGQNEFEETLHDAPTEIGYDAPAWTPALVQQHLDDTYDVEYSLPSCRRLLKEAGVSYQKPRRTATETNPDDHNEFQAELKKAMGDGRHSSLYRSNEKIRPSRAAYRAETTRHAAGRRTLWPA